MLKHQNAKIKPRIPEARNHKPSIERSKLASLKINPSQCPITTSLITGQRFGSETVQIEHHKASPYEKEPLASPNHLLALFQDHVSRGESAVVPGHFTPFSYFPSTLNLYSQGTLPACRSFGNMTMLVCALSPEFVYEVGKEIETPSIVDFRRITNCHDRPLADILTLLTTGTHFGGFADRLYRDYLTHALALRLLWIVRKDRSGTPLLHPVWPHRVLRRVLEKMEAEAGSNLDLNTLAAESGYSRSHFLRLFRAGVGCAPHQWLMQIRVQRAKELLAKSSDSIFDIAVACGFSSQAHFSRAFRQLVGIAPSKYRWSRGLLV